MAVSWPAKIKDQGGIRSQFHHVIDIAPTILDLVGIPQPNTVDGIAQRVGGLGFRDTHRRAHIGRLHEHRQAEFGHDGIDGCRRDVALVEGHIASLRNACCLGHLLGHRFVHTHRRRQYPAAHVRHVEQFEQALHRAVFTHRPVQQGHHHGGTTLGHSGADERCGVYLHAHRQQLAGP